MTDKKSIPESSAAALEAMIQYNNSGFHRHILREIRSDGAFVEMGNVRVLQQNAPVRVVFVHHDKGANCESREGVVTHNGRKRPVSTR